MAFEPVNGVQAAAPTTGLVASGLTPADGARWEDGFAWRSERCPTAQGFDPCGETFETPAAGVGGDDINYYRPVAFRVYDECSTRIRDYDQERVRRQADAVTSWMLARELEQGTLSRANPYVSPLTGGDLTGVNAYLAQASGAQIVAGAPHTPLAALGLIEEAARDGQLGMDPFIHVAPRLLPHMLENVEREGNLLRTKTGARVVVDAGYTGAGPLDVAAATSEVQTVTITGTPTGGDFTLTFQGDTTTPIPFDAVAATVRVALEGLPDLGPGDVVVGGGPGPDTPWTVTFAQRLGNVPEMTATGNFSGGTAPAVAVTTTTPGVNPAAMAGDWIYATGPVQVRLSPVAVLPNIQWIRNTQSVIAERLIAATFDPCTLRAAQVTVPEPAA